MARHRNPAAKSDAADARAHGIRYNSAYRHLISTDLQCAPGDHETALRIVAQITAAMTDMLNWTDNEKSRLYELRKKWQARADGRDPRFEIAGNRRGRLSREQESHVRTFGAMERIRELCTTVSRRKERNS